MGLTCGMSRIWMWEVEEMGKGTLFSRSSYLLLNLIIFFGMVELAITIHSSSPWGKQTPWFLFSLAVVETKEVAIGCKVWGFASPYCSTTHAAEENENPSRGFYHKSLGATVLTMFGKVDVNSYLCLSTKLCLRKGCMPSV